MANPYAKTLAPVYTPRVPKWYLGTGITDPATDPSTFYRIANNLIPYMAPAEQKSIATFLGNATKEAPFFGGYLGMTATPADETPNVSTETRQQFLSAERAKQAIAQLEYARQAHGVTEEQLGPGYKFLKQAISLLEQFGGTPDEGITRAEYEQLQAGLQALTSQGSGIKELAPYADLAQKFINPTLLGGSIMPTTTTQTGRTVYGQASKQLFR